MAKTSFDTDNLVTATKPLNTVRVLKVEAGKSVVRGEVLKKGTTGLVNLALATDVPYCVALQTVDATAGALPLVYTYDGSILASELTFAVGTIADYRDDFVTSTNLLIEE
jgi:hypothetical protein